MELKKWETAILGEDRSVAAARIREAYEKKWITLDLSGCDTITTLPENWPESVSVLRLEDCASVELLPTLPEKLEELELIRCLRLHALPEKLPETLKALYLTRCSRLKILPQKLPESLIDLRLERCDIVETLPKKLPEKLETLGLINCAALETLSENLPSSLIALRLEGCVSIKTLPKLPMSLQILDLSTTISLRQIPNHLPDSLQEFYFRGRTGCTLLLDHLPSSLVVLDIRGNTTLRELPDHLPPNLQIMGYNPDQFNPQEAWYRKVGKTQEEMTSFKIAWSALKHEPYYASFESLLRRLGEHELKNSVLPTDVADVIMEVLQSPRVRTQIFEMAQSADQDCHDRPLSIFNTVQSLARLSRLQREGASIKDILNLAEGILKMALLDEVTPKIMTKQWREARRSANEAGNGPDVAEALEVQLALRYTLAETLNLPFKIGQPLYTDMAGLTVKDKRLAVDYVEKTLSDLTKKIERLASMPIIASYMHDLCYDDAEKIKNKYETLQEVLEDEQAHGKLNDQTYNDRYTQLAKEREAEMSQLLMRKLQTLYSRDGRPISVTETAAVFFKGPTMSATKDCSMLELSHTRALA